MRGLLLWFLSGIAYAMRGIETIARQVQEQVKQREHQIVYKEFEAAINTWEKRTGRTVEREFRDDVGSGEGRDWKNFAAFLGSREATKWRKFGLSLDEMMNEWEQMRVTEPEMTIEGEENEI
jgi:hypothetical protein